MEGERDTVKTFNSLKTLLVEPHPDDICLSLYYFCKNFFLDKKYLVTVSEIKNREDSSKFSEKINATYLGSLNLKDIDWSLRIKKNITWENLEKSYEKYFKESEKLKEGLENLIEKYDIEVLVLPLGILHPFHFFVRKVGENIKVKGMICYYAEFPYKNRLYGKKLIDSIPQARIINYLPSEEDIEEKIKIFLQNYPSQRNILLNKWNEAKNLKEGETLLWILKF